MSDDELVEAARNRDAWTRGDVIGWTCGNCGNTDNRGIRCDSCHDLWEFS